MASLLHQISWVPTQEHIPPRLINLFLSLCLVFVSRIKVHEEMFWTLHFLGQEPWSKTKEAPKPSDRIG